MHRLSMVQALSLWQSLDDAYYGKSDFGGDVAEIYVHRLMPRSPLAEDHFRAKEMTSHGKAAAREAIQAANESFHNLLMHFAKERDATVEIRSYATKTWTPTGGGEWGFVEIGEWLKTWGEDHRFYVRVRPRSRP